MRLRPRDLFIGKKFASENSYSDALTDQTAFKARLRETFNKVDFIILPTLQSVSAEKAWLGANLVFELRVLGLQNTEPMNLVGNPALVLPIPLKGRSVPVTSLQLVGRNRSEAELLNAGRWSNPDCGAQSSEVFREARENHQCSLSAFLLNRPAHRVQQRLVIHRLAKIRRGTPQPGGFAHFRRVVRRDNDHRQMPACP